MKLDLSNTFLNGNEDVTAAMAPQTARVRWGRRAVLIAITLAVVGYLVLIGSALLDQFRPAISPLSDGWFRVTDRDRKFQLELPASPTKRTLGAQVEYHLYNGMQCTVTVRSYSVARELLNKTATKVLQEAAQTNGLQEQVTVLGSGLLDSKTHWIESKIIGGGPDGYAIRRRLMIHDKQLLELIVTGQEAEVMAADATRIMNSARWLNR
ncbi:MAG: hypothetical protein H7062_22095 [Candidatus Saccharimonas sp.]|nr:hypothetical protein [Planctomycetaceae bacterium]